MYCATCGNLIEEKLNYCNRCGNRVFKNELASQSEPNVSALDNLSGAIGYVGVAGLGGFVGLIAILVGNRVDPTFAAFLAITFAATAFGICFLLARQISSLTEIAKSERQQSKQQSAPEQLNSPITGQIEAPREPFLSVTENTTRTLDKTKI